MSRYFAFTIALACLQACSYPRTQTIIDIHADAVIERDATEIHIEVRDASSLVVFRQQVVTTTTNFSGYPLEIPVSARRGEDSRSFEVRALAMQSQRRADGSIAVNTLSENRIRAFFERGSILRFPLHLLTNCPCNLESERCEPDRDGDAIPECAPLWIERNDRDGAVTIDATLDAPSVDTNAVDGNTADSAASDVSTSCGADTPDRCPNACVRLESDRMNCGMCGNVCANDTLCVNRVCATPPQCRAAQDPQCVGATYCNLTTRMCAPGCDGRSGQCSHGTTCNVSTHECRCESPNQMCGGNCVSCPSGNNILTSMCSGNVCVVATCSGGQVPHANGRECTPNGNAGVWTSLASTGPSARRGHSMVYDSAQNRVVMFGGSNGSSSFGNAWVFSGSAWMSTFFTNSPPARSLHAMVFDSTQNRVVTFGGSVSGVSSNSMWQLNNSAWSTVATVGDLPASRSGHAMVYDSAQNRVVLFGGLDISGQRLHDTWIFSGNAWSELQTSTAPSARALHSMVYDSAQNRVVLFGGTDMSNLFDDTWVFANNTWTPMVPSRTPPARYGHAMAYDAAAQRVVLFGGLSPAQTALSDTWTLTGNAWTQGPQNGPSARAGHAMTYDTAMNRVVLFGGYDGAGNNFNDTWIFR